MHIGSEFNPPTLPSRPAIPGPTGASPSLTSPTPPSRLVTPWPDLLRAQPPRPAL